MSGFFIGLIMGFFSTKKINHRFAVVQRMMQDKDFKYSSDIGTNRYLQIQRSQTSLNMNESIVDYLLEASQNSLPKKFEKAYRYASKPNIFGKPKVSINLTQSNSDISNSYKRQLKQQYADVNVIYAKVGTKYFYHWLWKRLFDDYGYNGQTNELTVLSQQQGTACYLESGQLYISQRSLKAYDFIAQTGLSLNHGKCFERVKDFARQQPEIVIADRDYATITYAYAETIEDNQPPESVIVNGYQNQFVKGYAEQLSQVEIYHKGSLIKTTDADATGLFETQLDRDYSLITIRCIDGSHNPSTPIEVENGYTNPYPTTQGNKPTITQKIIYKSVEISLEDINPILQEGDTLTTDTMYLQSGYVINDGYKVETRQVTTEEILSQYSFDEDIGDYYPRLYIRKGDADIVQKNNEDSPEYEYMNKLFKQVSLDLDTVTKQVADGIGENYELTNYIYIGLDANINQSKDDTQVCEYLYKYFLRLYSKCKKIDEHKRLGLVFKVQDKAYTQVVEFDGIEFNKKTAKVLDVGKYKIIRTVNDVHNDSLLQYFVAHDSHTILFQESENIVAYIKVKSLRSSHILNGGWVTASGDDENLVIPIDRKLVKELTPREREVLFYKCLHVHVFMTQVTEEKWYQSKWFKVVMAVVTVVLTIVVAPAGASLGVIMQNLLVNTAIATVTSVVVNQLAKVAVKLGLSPEIAGAIAFIATIVATAYAGGGFNFSQAFNANNMLRALNTSFDIVNKVATANIQQIQKEMDNFQQQVASQKEQLAKAQEILNTGVIPLDMELLISPVNLYINLGETVEEFYTRTLNVDVTEITQNIASAYVDITTLPPNYRTVMARLKGNTQNEIDNVLML